LNFLPDYHMVVVKSQDLSGTMEDAFAQHAKKFGKTAMPRLFNFITGPSRSGDIEQKLLFGAHGPRSLHIIVVD
jgi:L-lactate dehydrogenase complex protein LldG